MRLTEEERFWDKVEITDWCWLWVAYIGPDGYGQFSYEGGRLCKAHRYAWELLVGEIPKTMTLDHECRVRHCVNPEHMRVATVRENVLAGYGPTAVHARKTHCIRGHMLSGENLYNRSDGKRECRECGRAKDRRRQKTKGRQR